MTFSRRDFVKTSVLGALPPGVGAHFCSPHALRIRPAGARFTEATPPSARSSFAQQWLCLRRSCLCLLKGGGDTLDAAIQVVKGPENDPNDDSVGFGGLPNEEGVVELDACCMHGPTRRAGSVGGVRNIKNVSMVAKAVMEHTGHVMLVGEGAERFAVAMGFPRENLLTERSRKIWMLWKEFHSIATGGDRALPILMESARRCEAAGRILAGSHCSNCISAPPISALNRNFASPPFGRVLFPPTGTIHCSALNDKGEISGITTTSGLAFKLPGRCRRFSRYRRWLLHRSGCGSAGATGSGEENIKVAGAHTIVENMRHGMSPQEAGMDALKRIVRNYNGDMNKLRFMDMTYYILRKDGAYAGVCRCGKDIRPASRTKSRSTTERCDRKDGQLRCLKDIRRNFRRSRRIPEDLKKDSEYLK